MSSKIILIAVAVFFGVMGKNLSMEDFAAWCKLVLKECHFNDHAGECEVVRFTAQFFFILDKAKALPNRIGSQSG